MMRGMTWLAEVEDLAIRFPGRSGVDRFVVDGVTWRVEPGEAVGLVGESGSGKSLSALALMGLVPPPGRVCRGRVKVQDRDVLAMGDTELQRIRGAVVGLVLQEPSAALNPVRSVGFQVSESAILHRRAVGRREARERAMTLLEEVGLSPAREFCGAYLHQLSGGQRQRVLLAAALAGDPVVLVADEPASALDPPSQLRLLELLAELQRRRGLGLVVISHDLAVVSRISDSLGVILAGETVEWGGAGEVLSEPGHPYTRLLVEAVPRLGADGARSMLPGEVGLLRGDTDDGEVWPASGRCRFAVRCPAAMERCRRQRPDLYEVSPGRRIRCFLAHDREAPGEQ